MDGYISFMDHKLNIVKMSIFLKWTYIFLMQLQSNLSRVFVESQKLMLTFIWKSKVPKANKSEEA